MYLKYIKNTKSSIELPEYVAMTCDNYRIKQKP